MQIAGLQKTTLVDFPGRIAATVFTRGCPFRCPFCHNPELVLPEKFIPLLDEKEVWNFFKKRRHQLQGVCITGGEPTLQKDLPLFVAKLKSLGYKTKLDTNGSDAKMLSRLIDSGNIDYIAMDIKTTVEKYPSVAIPKSEIGPKTSLRENPKQILNSHNQMLKPFDKLKKSDFDIVSSFELRASNLKDRIRESIKLIMASGIDYEFRTTVVHPIHKVKDFEEIGKLLKGPEGAPFGGAKRYYIQNFVQSKHIDEHQKFAPFTDKELKDIKKIVMKYINKVIVR